MVKLFKGCLKMPLLMLCVVGDDGDVDEIGTERISELWGDDGDDGDDDVGDDGDDDVDDDVDDDGDDNNADDEHDVK